MRKPAANHLPQAMVTPAVLIMILLSLLPLAYGVWLSLTNWSLFSSLSPHFEGLTAYQELLHDSTFWAATGRSLLWTAGTLIIEVVIALPLALLINYRTPVTGVVTALVLLPWVTPFVVLAYSWLYLYDGTYGVFHAFLAWLHIVGPASPLSVPSQALYAMTLVSGWKGAPFLTIALLAVLKGIPQELYEAAEVDGASKWQRFTEVTLPTIMPTMLAMCFVLGIQAFYSFDLVWLTTKGGPGDATTLVGLLMFRTFYISQRPGYAAALGTGLLLLIALLTGLGLLIRQTMVKFRYR